MIDKGPIFIFGAPRSGTSLLSRILNAHPQIGIPYESMIYKEVYPWRKYYGDLANPKNKERLVDDVLSLWWVRHWTPIPDRDQVLAYFTREDFHGVVDALMRAWLVTQGKQRWGEKSPQHMFQWRAITQAFPDARVLHMLRDGRDVAVSWKNAPFGPRRYESIARRWVAYVEAGEACRQALGPGRFMEVRYESLLENSEHVVRTVSSFLNIDYSSQMIGFHEKQSHYPTDNRNIENLGRPIMKKNAGKWRDEMGSRDLQYFEAIAGPTLHALGYQRACSNPMGPKLGSSIMGQLENIYGKLSHRKAYMAAFGIWRMRLRLLVRSGK